MSGIIGGAGSRTGIIGRGFTTDPSGDYEEGTFSPSPNAGTINTISHNRYRKVGGVCWLEAYFGNIQSPGFSNLSGIPFATNPSGTSYENITGSVMANDTNWHNDTVNIGVYVYNNAISFYQTKDDSGWQAKNTWDSGDDIYFSLHYMCAV